MFYKRAAAIPFIASCLLATAAISDQRSVSWSDLAPEVAFEPINNPFEGLSRAQMDSLRTLLRFQLAGTNQSVDPDLVAELRDELSADGLDVDWLFEQRRIMMEQSLAAIRSTNEDIIGQDVRLPGYILPLEMEGQKVVEFLLVPTVGACIHTPPPPANQMVRVVYPEGIEVNGLYTPVWISGVMTSEFSKPDVRYSDGQLQVEVTYAMRPERVELYAN